MKKLIKISLLFVFTLIAHSSFADLLDDFSKSEWIPEHSYFGRTPWGFCKLSIQKERLVISEKSEIVMNYRVATAQPTFIIFEVETSPSGCYNPKVSGKSYWRFDTKDYWTCAAWKADSKNCPKEFPSYDDRKFEVSIFHTLVEAKNYSSEPLDAHGYYLYSKQ